MRYRGLFVFAVIVISAFTAFSQSRNAVSGAEATGTFRTKSGNEFKIQALGKGKLKIAFSGTYEYKYKNELLANTGEAYGTADIAGDTATFKPDNTEGCVITIKFKPNKTIVVDQDGDDAACGFGAHVYSDGTYRKVSNGKPKFE
jgi:hypothetical protein